MAGTDTNKVTINVNGTNIEFTKIGNILGPAGKDGIDGKSIYAKTVDPWSVSGWNPAVAGDLFLNTTTGILWSAKASAVTSNVKNNWTKVGELAGKITVDSTLSSTSTNPVQNKVINDALGKKANVSHSHSSLTNSSGRIFNVPTGGSGGEQKTLVITDDLNAYQPAGNYASSTHKHPISDITNLQSTIDGIYTDMGLQDEAIAGKADSVHTHEISNINGLQSALNGKSNLDHNHNSVYQAKGDYATNDALKNYVTGTTFIDYTTYIEGEVNKKANVSHNHEISNVNGLQSALDGKAASSHTHTISNITNLQSTIDGIYTDMGLQDEAIAGKSDIGHTHKKSEITDLTIPTVNNPTITINQGGVKKGSFSLNQSGAATIDLTDNNTTYTAGTGLSLSNGAFSVKTGYTTSGKNYKVTTDNNGNLYVNVPWNNDTWRPVVDNLTTTDATKSLSANQGKVLKDLVDSKLNNYGTDTSRPNGTSFTFPGGSNPVQMRSGNKSAGADIGIFSLTDDNAFICNSSDNGYAFAVFDTDKTADFSTASNAAFAVLSEHAGVSIKGRLTVDGTSVSLNGHTHSQYLTAHQDISGKYNTSDLGNTTFKVTRGASQSTKNTGYWAGMLHSTQGGSPVLPSNGKWWHVISMDWTGTDTNNWISQLALPTQDGGVPHYRRNDGGGGVFIDNSTWHAFITDENIGSQNVKYANSAGSVAWGNVSGRPSSLPASDVYAWAKAATKPSYTKSEVGLGNVDNTADANKNVNSATSSYLLRTYNANNNSHGADYYLKCRHNVDGNDRFKLQIVRSNGSVTHSTSVDYANSAGSATDSTKLPLSGGTLNGTLGFRSNYLIKPVAEFRTQDNTFTGAITIALPAGISNTMVSMWIDVYNYVTNTSFSVHVGGYTYENNTWQYNPFAMVYGANHTVRLGHNGTNFVIYIGETNSTWNYPQISVRNVILGYAPAYDNWKKDWGISFVTSFSNVSATINNYAWTTKNFSMSFSNGVLTITYNS